MAKTTPFFLNFQLKEARCLIELIRTGKICYRNIEILEWIAFDEDTLLGTGIQILKKGYVNKYGIHFEFYSDLSLKLGSITHYDAVFTSNLLASRRKILSKVIKDTLKSILLSNKFVIDYLLIEDQIPLAISKGCAQIFNCIGKNISCIGENNKLLFKIPKDDMLDKVTQHTKASFLKDLDNLEIAWSGYETGSRAEHIEDMLIFIPNRIEFRTNDDGFAISSRKMAPRKLTLSDFIEHVYRYNPMHQTLHFETYRLAGASDEETQFLKDLYQTLDKAIDDCYVLSS
jgi:hypothetical protein